MNQLSLSTRYSFEHDNPVPDGMPFSIISEINHPPNVAVIKAPSMIEATHIARKAFTRAADAVVWLANPDLASILEGSETTKIENNQKLLVYGGRLTFDLRTIFRQVCLFPPHPQTLSCFYPHVDYRTYPNTDLDTQEFLTADIVDSLHLRIVANTFGCGTVIFGKNIAVAERLLTSPDFCPALTDLGHAYITPTGSVTFLAGCNFGVTHASIHSPPHVPNRGDVKPVRHNFIFDCTP